MKKNKKSLKLNIMMNSILTMSSFIFPLITFPYVSRILLPEGTGKLSFVTAIVTYFTMFSQLGIPTYGIKECAKVRDDKEKLSKTVQELMIINLFMCVIVYGVFFIIINTVPRLKADKTLFVIVSSTILFNALGVEWLYKAMEEYTYITVRSIVFKFIALIAMFLLVKEKSDYIIYGAISIFASSASNILNCINLRNVVDIKPLGNYNFKKHIKFILIFFAMSVATVIYTNLDTVMLGFMSGDIEVGYYNAAVKIKSILVSIVTSVSAVLLPRTSYYVEQNKMDEFYEITKKAINFVIIISVPMAIYFVFFAKQGILFLSGDAYGGAIIPMKIIMPTLIFIGLTNIIGIQMMVPLGLEKHVLYSEIAGALVDVVINIILIPRYGASGAAVGTLVAEFVVLLWQYAVMRKTLICSFKNIKYFKVLAGVILGTVTSIWAITLKNSSFIILAISALIFFGIYVISLLLLKEPMVLEIEKQLVSKINFRIKHK